MAISIAPGLSAIYIYEAPVDYDGSYTHFINVLNKMANDDNLPSQLCCSWSLSVDNSTLRASGESVFKQMAAQGQSFFCASGDKGSYSGSIAFPFESPNITLVGGTNLTTAGPCSTYVSETVWNDSDGSSGGGISSNYTIPSWQSVVNVTSNGGSTIYRNIPDVAMVATNNWHTFGNGSSSGSGKGTSYAAPLWAGYMALVNQQLTSSGLPVAGFLNANIYAAAASQSRYAADFHDITSGSNGTYSAGTGYDLCTGLGSPNGLNLANDLSTVFTLTSPVYLESGGSGASYLRNGTGISSYPSSINVSAGANVAIQGISQNSNRVFSYWSDGNAQNPRVLSVPISTSLYGIYKGIHLSNDASAFSLNSQRRLIQTTAGGVNWLHQVYTSGGHVWIEHSSDNGSTWVLGNGGKPLDNGGGKCPSIAYGYYSTWQANYLAVVWQQPSGSTYTIQGEIFNQLGNDVPNPTYAVTLFTEPIDAYSNDANPNIVLTNYAMGNYILTVERKNESEPWQPGLYWFVGSIYDSGTRNDGPLNSPISYGLITGQPTTITHSQISLNPYYGDGSSIIDVDMIYQMAGNNSVQWKYIDFYPINGGPYWTCTEGTPDTLSGSALNYNPSVVSFANGQFGACWINNIAGNENGGWADVDQMVYVYGENPTVRSYYGAGVQSCAINRGDIDAGFAAWSQIYNNSWSNKSIRVLDYYPSTSTIQTLSTSGKYVQVANSNGSTLSNMYVSSFYPFTTPYYFQTSSSLTPLNKKNASAPSAIIATTPVTGRGFAITKDSVEFTYRFENLSVDGNQIDFVDVPDTVDYSNIDNLNSALLTKPFQVKANSKVTFTERSGFSDSAAAIDALGKEGYIRCKMELVDNATGKSIGTVKTQSFTSSAPHAFKMPSYVLDTKEFAGKTVQAKITLATNLADTAVTENYLRGKKMVHRSIAHSNIVLTKSFANVNTASADSSREGIAMESIQPPSDFSLVQNYPNPFNPTTTISYQLPENARVLLKIYDVLGREIATLVDGMKEPGAYNATFDGSRFASGMYFAHFIVTPQSGAKQIVQVKKMLMLK